MKKVLFRMRNVVAAATCLAAMTIFASCEKTPTDDGGGGGNNAKLVSKIVIVTAEETSGGNREITMTFDYDSQNRVSKIGGNYSNLNVSYYADSITMDGTLTRTDVTESVGGGNPTYTERTVAFHFAAPLNSSGYISSIKGITEYGTEEIPITYTNGFLDNYKVLYTEDETGYETMRYTWTNENIAKMERTRDNSNSFDMWKYEYGFNYLNKSNIDLSQLSGGGSIEIMLYSFLGLTGKKCKNLPVKITNEYGYGTEIGDTSVETLTYTFDTDGYALSIVSGGFSTSIEYK